MFFEKDIRTAIATCLPSRHCLKILSTIKANCFRIAQDNSYLDYVAARTLQRWFRGYITRKYISHLHDCATIIQKHWRGYTARNQYYCLLQVPFAFYNWLEINFEVKRLTLWTLEAWKLTSGLEIVILIKQTAFNCHEVQQ